MKTIPKAGAIILSTEKPNHILLVYRAKRDDWTFPKGHIEPNEKPEETMVRELKEETGLSVKVIKQLPDHQYTNEVGIVCPTTMYLVVSTDDTQLKPEYPGDRLEWIPFEQVNERLSYENLKEYVTAYQTQFVL